MTNEQQCSQRASASDTNQLINQSINQSISQSYFERCPSSWPWQWHFSGRCGSVESSAISGRTAQWFCEHHLVAVWRFSRSSVYCYPQVSVRDGWWKDM